jgi:Set1/Ash2 histone methyltransferase complex subunit ASH2
MCETAIANLMKQNEDRVAFSKDKEIIPFIEANWDILTTMPRRIKQTWHNTVGKTMLKENDVFICDNRDINDPQFALRYGDLYKIGPSCETNIKSVSSGRLPGEATGFGRGFGRGAKRKFGGLSHLEGNEYTGGKRQKSELSHPKLPSNGFPTEYPYNKDGYRYILAEPDPHGPYRQEFEESQDLAGKPIPGWLCRKLMPDRVALSLHDRAPQLKVRFIHYVLSFNFFALILFHL